MAKNKSNSGYLDRAKDRFNKSDFGDEMLGFEEYEDDEVEEEEEHESEEEAESRPSLSHRVTGVASKLADQAKKEFTKKQKKEKKKKPNRKEVAVEEELDDNSVDFSDSAFDIDEEDEKEVIEGLSQERKKTKGQKIQNRKDILALMNIPETFVIEDQYYLPNDLNNIEFSYETPMGFSPKEVERFFNGVVRTVKHYVDLLHKRNDHIIELAEKVDEKDDVIKKLKYESEIAQGINVVPTQGDQMLENDLANAKLEIRDLRKQLEAHENTVPVDPGLDSEEREKYNELQDEFSRVMRRNQELESEVRSQRMKIMQLEEDSGPDFTQMFANDKKSNSSGDGFEEFRDNKKKRGIPNNGNPFLDED